MKRDAIRDAGLRELGAYDRLREISQDAQGRPHPFEERCRRFEEYKVELKKVHRKVSLECHPDRNMDASEEERKRKSERFNRVTRAVNFLLNELKPKPPQARRPMPMGIFSGGQVVSRGQGGVVIVNLGGQRITINDMRFSGGVSNSTTTSSTGGYWPWS